MENVVHIRIRFTWRLFAWSIASILVGVPMIFVKQPFVASVGWQFAIWGAIDLIFVIAGFRKNATLEAGDVAETASLVRALRFNGKWMNPMWLATGVALLIWGFAAHNNLSLLGHGAGILIQAGFLFAFDRAFLKALTDAP